MKKPVGVTVLNMGCILMEEFVSILFYFIVNVSCSSHYHHYYHFIY